MEVPPPTATPPGSIPPAAGVPSVNDPGQRDPSRIPSADSYRRNDAVWVYRNGSWHPGVVNGVSPLAVMVTYQSIGGRGTVVDTVTPEYLLPHRGPDPVGGR